MAQINFLTRIEFETGAAAGLGQFAGESGMAAPLVVTDAGLVATGLIEKVLGQSSLNGAVVFDATPANPTEDAVESAHTLYRQSQCDGLISIGGGSPIDLAKAVAVRVSHEGPLREYALIVGGAGRIKGPLTPHIAVPTTAGTGAEVGRAALISFKTGEKLALISPHLIPTIAVCDPELTRGLPAGLTAATGMDAVTHCIETYLSPRFNPPAEAIALDGLRRALGAIEMATSDGGDMDARSEMMMAALQGGLTFQKGLGGVHSLSHPLGAVPGSSFHHGTLNAILLPHFLTYNLGAVDEKYRVLCDVIGVAGPDQLAGYFAALTERLGLPAKLSDIGVTAEMGAVVAPLAEQDHSTATNAKPVKAADFAEIFKAAL
ncbi:MAG: iron-containing alcohol dehydrogenase [Alphaproteobacteria bacterium]